MRLSPEVKTSSAAELMLPTTWKVAPGVCWIQCNDPQTARRLRRLKDARQVVWWHSGPFLEVYEVPWPLSRAGRWVERSIRSIYDRFSDQILPERAFDRIGVSSQRMSPLECSQSL